MRRLCCLLSVLLTSGCAWHAPRFRETITAPDGTVTETTISGNTMAWGGAAVREAQTGVDYETSQWRLRFRGASEGLSSPSVPFEWVPYLAPLFSPAPEIRAPPEQPTP